MTIVESLGRDIAEGHAIAMLWRGKRWPEVLPVTGLTRAEIRAAQLAMVRDDWLAGHSRTDISSRCCLPPSEVLAALRMYGLVEADRPRERQSQRPCTRNDDVAQQEENEMREAESYERLVEERRNGAELGVLARRWGLEPEHVQSLVRRAETARERLPEELSGEVSGMIADILDGHGVQAVSESYDCLVRDVQNAWQSVHATRIPERFKTRHRRKSIDQVRPLRKAVLA